MRHWSTVSLIGLLFATPLIEAAVVSVLPPPAAGFGLFPLLAIVAWSHWRPGPAAVATLLGAAWRDAVLLATFAPTLLGTLLLGATVAIARNALLSRSVVTESLTALSAYSAYTLGAIVAALPSRGFEISPSVASGPFAAGLLAVLLITAVRVWPHRLETSGG